MAGLLDLTLTDRDGTRLADRQLAIVNRADGSPATLYNALSGGEPLGSHVVSTDERGGLIAYCAGTFRVLDAITGAVLRDRLVVVPYVAPDLAPVSTPQAEALGLKADQVALNQVAGLPAGGLRAVIFGSSTDSRCHVDLGASITVAGGVATVTTQRIHQCHSKALVSIGKNNAVGALQNWRHTGQITRTGDSTFTLPAPGAPAGTAPTDVRLLQHLAPPSWWRMLVQELGGGLELVANFAQGGETTSDKLGQYQLLDALQPQLVIGAFGAGNDVLNGDTSNTTANLQTMVRYHTTRGRWVVLCLPPCTPQLTVQQMTIGVPIMEWAVAERRRNPRLLLLDEFALTVDPMTGQGRAELFVDPANVHANKRYADIKGKALAALLKPLMGKLADGRALSINDRVSAHPQSRQLVEGFWTLVGLANAGSRHNKATGLVDPGITEINLIGSAGRAVACSVVARADGRGYDQRMVFSGEDGDNLRVVYAGPAGATLASRLLANKRYDAAASLKIVQSAAGVLLGYEHILEAVIGGVTARLSSHVSINLGIDEPSPAVEQLEDPALFPRFEMPAVASAVQFVLQLELAATGSVTIDWGLLTMRQRPDPEL